MVSLFSFVISCELNIYLGEIKLFLILMQLTIIVALIAFPCCFYVLPPFGKAF